LLATLCVEQIGTILPQGPMLDLLWHRVANRIKFNSLESLWGYRRGRASGGPRVLDEPGGGVGVDVGHGEREGEAAAHVEAGVHAEPRGGHPVEDGVDFNEFPWRFRDRPGRVCVPLLPPREAGEVVSSKDALYRRKWMKSGTCVQGNVGCGVYSKLDVLGLHERPFGRRASPHGGSGRRRVGDGATYRSGSVKAVHLYLHDTA